MNRGDLNVGWAIAFVDELTRSGLDTVVVAPGSRSTPLVLAVDRHPAITTVVQLDERSAAFFALGVGKATGRPAAVITTSGTAVANLFPAVVEAAQSETPLLLLTADRPASQRGTDANQTIDQERIFGSYATFRDAGVPYADAASFGSLRTLARQALAGSQRAPAGPVHVNFPFEKPLHPAPGNARVLGEFGALDAPGSDDALDGVDTPDALDVADVLNAADAAGASHSHGAAHGTGYGTAHRAAHRADAEEMAAFLEAVAGAERGLVIAGPTACGTSAASAIALARATGFPLLADPLSTARFTEDEPEVVRIESYDLILRDTEARRALRPDFVIRVGRAPTSAATCTFLSELGAGAEAEVWVIDEGGRWTDHTGAATSHLVAAPSAVASVLEMVRREADSDWVGAWAGADRAARAAVENRLRDAAVTASGAAEAVATVEAVEGLPPEGLLFVSSSMPIRDVDAFVYGGQNRMCIGNRGASGIDGIASTALGAAFAVARPTLVIVGDLAFLHDLTGLFPASGLDLPVVFLVLDNRGGGIFHMLPIREFGAAFTRYFTTPHELDFRHVGALYDLPYRPVSPGQVRERVSRAFAEGGTHILHVRSDAEENRQWRRETVDAVRRAVIETLNESSILPDPETQ